MAEPTLHHVGCVVPCLEEGIARWRLALAATGVDGPYEDPLQKVKVVFLEFEGGGTRIELVEPVGADSPVARFLEKGGGLHHTCFEVDDLEAHLARMKPHAMRIRAPLPAVAFGGRRVAWMMTRDRLLVEYLERQLQ